jgi:hypothetical protein
MTDAYGALVGEAKNILGRTASSSLFIIRYPLSDRTPVFTVRRWRPVGLERGAGAPAICIVILVLINIANVWKTAFLTAMHTV